MKNILVTGGAGFIGGQACHSLVDSGFNVSIIDNLSTGSDKFLPKSVRFFKEDLKNIDSINEIFKNNNFDAVLHFASSIKNDESTLEPLNYYKNNTINTLNLLDNMVKYNIKNLIFSSSASVYGAPKVNKGKFKENYPTNPLTPYGYSKMFSERFIIDICSREKINAIILRYFNVAGADLKYRTGQITNNSEHLIKVICKYLTGKLDKLYVFGNNYKTKDGTCVRDYLHVQDLINAHLLSLNYLLKSKNNYVEIFNCGSQNGYSVLEVIRETEHIIQNKITFSIEKRRKGDPESLIADSSKIKKMLGWKIKHNLSRIILDSLNWEKKKT